LAFKYIGKSLPYSEVAEALQVDISEVEKWGIDGKFPLLKYHLYSPLSRQSFVLVLFGVSYHKQNRAFKLFGPLLGHLSVSNGKY
jgi:hypothetical protein